MTKKKEETKPRRKKVFDQKEVSLEQTKLPVVAPKNVILLLKCSLKDIDDFKNDQVWKLNSCTYNPTVPPEIQSFDLKSTPFSFFQETPVEKEAYIQACPHCNVDTNVDEKEEDIELKLKQLKMQFYKQNVPDDKKSDCFWCTYPFDNPVCYILQQNTDGALLGHGSFCCPECAVAHLWKNMPWDDSAKFEAYQLMNHYYGKANHENIKSANCPYYFLDKYYGTLNIREFRRLSKSSHLFLVVEKPVSRVLPEIHEDNDKNTSSLKGTYKVKKQSEKHTPCRNNILRDNFGLSQL